MKFSTPIDRNLYDAYKTLTFLEVQYRASRVLALCFFCMKVVNGDYKQWILKGMQHEDLKNRLNAWAPPFVDKVPLLEEDVNDYKAPVNPPRFRNGDIRPAFLHMAQDTNTQ